MLMVVWECFNFIIMKFFIIYIVLFLSSCVQKQEYLNRINKNYDKKKILILTNSNGGGHNAAALATKMALESDYDIEIFDILKNKIFGEELFGYTSQKEYWTTLKYVLKGKDFTEKINKIYHGSYIENAITEKHPDLLISVFPVGVARYKEVADKLNIPFVVIPTDFNANDLHFYGLDNFENNADNANKFRLFLPFANDKIAKSISNKTIKDSVRYTGYPVRKDFLLFANEYRKNHDISNKIKQEYNILNNEKTILITMGGQSWAEDRIVDYVNEINNSREKIIVNQPLHVFVACGTNDNLEQRILGINILNKDLLKIRTKSWINGEEMAKIMAISDVMIAKPGGSTVAEILAIAKNVIFKPDSTFVIEWEKENMLLVNKYGLGDRFKTGSLGFDKDDFIAKINKNLLKNDENNNLPPINEFYINAKNEIDLLLSSDFKHHKSNNCKK